MRKNENLNFGMGVNKQKIYFKCDGWKWIGFKPGLLANFYEKVKIAVNQQFYSPNYRCFNRFSHKNWYTYNS